MYLLMKNYMQELPIDKAKNPFYEAPDDDVIGMLEALAMLQPSITTTSSSKEQQAGELKGMDDRKTVQPTKPKEVSKKKKEQQPQKLERQKSKGKVSNVKTKKVAPTVQPTMPDIPPDVVQNMGKPV